jgi:hypothetical protein
VPPPSLLVLLVSVYVSLSKIALLSRLSGVSLKADAKVRLFSEPPKLFEKKFQFSCKKVTALDICQTCRFYTHFYYIRTREGNELQTSRNYPGKRGRGKNFVFRPMTPKYAFLFGG